ncbi:MAG: methionyl-tRNA formyltransferase [Hyphomicrobiales bacterium]
MRVVFMGTPDFSVPTLMEIIAQGHEVVAVYSQPPRKAGRGMELKKSPVHEKAEQFGLPIFTPLNFKDGADIDAFAAHEADVAVVVAYGLLLPRAVLDAPHHGCLNLHASLLPRWRGAAPINRAIMAGDKETGIMVMQMEEGLDTGPVAMVEHLPIEADMTAGELHDQLMVLGGDLMVRALGGIERGGLSARKQETTGIDYAHKLTKEEARIDWSKSACDVHNHIRGLSPFPGAWCEFELAGKRHRLKILKSIVIDDLEGPAGTILDDALTIACGTGAIRLVSVQRSGKGVMDAAEFLRGNALIKGAALI